MLDTLQFQLQQLTKLVTDSESDKPFQAFNMTLFLTLNTLTLCPKKAQPTQLKEKPQGSVNAALKKTLKVLNALLSEASLVVQRDATHYFFDVAGLLCELKESETRELATALLVRCIQLWHQDLQYLKTLISNLIYENEQVTGPLSLLLQKVSVSYCDSVVLPHR